MITLTLGMPEVTSTLIYCKEFCPDTLVCQFVGFSLLELTLDHLLGMTDIDDKILKRAQEVSETPSVLAQRYEAEFFGCLNDHTS
jgi:hypothetical protein